MATQTATTVIQASSSAEYSKLKAFLHNLGIVAVYNDELLQATINASGNFSIPR